MRSKVNVKVENARIGFTLFHAGQCDRLVTVELWMLRKKNSVTRNLIKNVKASEEKFVSQLNLDV